MEPFPHPPNLARKKRSILKGYSGFDITNQKSVDILNTHCPGWLMNSKSLSCGKMCSFHLLVPHTHCCTQ